MPENYIQVLIILAANLDGLTTDSIFKQLQKAQYKGVKDIKAASNLVFNMRAKDLLTSSDAVGGKIHKITEKGKNELDKETGASNNPDKAPVCEISQTEALADGSPSPLTLEALNAAYNIIPLPFVDPLAEFDKAVEIMRKCIKDVEINAHYPEPWPKIADKQAKIELLEKLENMPLLEIWAIDMIAAVRADLDQFDAA